LVADYPPTKLIQLSPGCLTGDMVPELTEDSVTLVTRILGQGRQEQPIRRISAARGRGKPP
jgi:hypothetical protein